MYMYRLHMVLIFKIYRNVYHVTCIIINLLNIIIKLITFLLINIQVYHSLICHSDQDIGIYTCMNNFPNLGILPKKYRDCLFLS